jgi:crotonobetainyl-CoA:carnitine CoA-transferase CaiB-like acyl-CoA transferase
MRDMHVLEIAGSIAGAYCGRLFATTGADVVLVEPPEGAPVHSMGPWITGSVDGVRRSAPHEYLDAGKRSVTFGLSGADGDEALAWSDLVDEEPYASAARAERADEIDCRLQTWQHDRIDQAISRWTDGLSPGDAAARLQAVAIAASPVFSHKDLVEDEHLRAHGFMVEWDQPDVGPTRFPGYPIHCERSKPVVRGAPALGADNALTLAELGYDDDAIEWMAKGEVIFDRPPW